MLRLYFLQMSRQSNCNTNRQHRHSILPTLPVAHGDTRVGEIDIFYPVRYRWSRPLR